MVVTIPNESKGKMNRIFWEETMLGFSNTTRQVGAGYCIQRDAETRATRLVSRNRYNFVLKSNT